jgi:hypothetical protein
MDRDERPLDEIQFAIDAPEDERSLVAEETQRVFRLAGVKVAQDIIDLGCTGLTLATSLSDAQRIMPYMSGSICGLPCYVPPDRFCLVHNTIGALQIRGNVDGAQQVRHPEGVLLCSRELTEEECMKFGLIQRKIVEIAKKSGNLTLDEETETLDAPDTRLPAPLNKRLQDLANSNSAFKCPEHSSLNPKCRFCLAQAVTEGPLQPSVEFICIYKRGEKHTLPLSKFESSLDDSDVIIARLVVTAASWTRKLARD